MNLKRFFGLLLILAFLLSAVTGCKNNIESSDDEQVDVVYAPNPLKVLVVGEAQLGPRIARQWSARRDGKLTIVDKTLEEFVESEFAVDPSFDILIYPPSILGELVDRNHVRKVAKFVWTSDELNKNELLRHFRTSIVRHLNQEWAVPLGSPNFAMFCNRELFEKMDVAPPKTWDELDRRIKNITESLGEDSESGLIAKVDMPLAKGWAVHSFLARVAPSIRNRGKISTVFDRSSMNPLITDVPFVEALNQLKSIASKRSLELDPAATYALALSEKSSIAFTWPSRIFEVDVETDDEGSGIDPVMIRPLPGMLKWYDNANQAWNKRGDEDDGRVDLIGFDGLVASVSDATDNDATAWEFLQWLPSKTVSLLTLVDSPSVGPFRASHLGDASRWTGENISVDLADDYADIVADNHERTLVMMFPRIPGSRAYLDSLDEAVRDCIADKLSAEEALKAAAKRWDEITDSLDRKKQIEMLRDESRF